MDLYGSIWIYMDLYGSIWIYTYIHDQDSVHSKGMSQTSKRLLCRAASAASGLDMARHDWTMENAPVVYQPTLIDQHEKTSFSTRHGDFPLSKHPDMNA